jgi:hypothetical protein
MTFTNGLVKSSTWLDGIFSNGLFYNSNTFNGNKENFSYNENNINSFYKSGITGRNVFTSVELVYNNRLSWQNGTFSNGEFYKSDWEGGNFNGGKFYYSKFYNGIINGGIIGDPSITTGYTKIYTGTINYTTVENAAFISESAMKMAYSNGNIQWLNGIFNGGIFSTYNNLNFATWSGGIFNRGDFTGTAKWLNGTFNGGKFTSYYNSSQLQLYSTSDIKANYSWEYGVFNGGEFGSPNYYNSSWFDGEFNGGYFKGMVWNNGVFTSGEFFGSGNTQSGHYAIGGTESSNAQGFISSFRFFRYGIWKDGFVTDTKDRYINRKIYSDLKRVSDTDRNLKSALLRDIIWMSGTFSHPSGTIQNSVWINGTFENGTFKSSSFNPYVTRNIFSQPLSSKNFNISDTCIWKNGTLIDSDFYMSKWENGNFISGNGYGMIWKNGIVSYMNAYNIFWENGLWRNGNWYGSNFDLNTDGSITSDFEKQIIFRGMNWRDFIQPGGTSSCHVWNIFLDESLSNINSFIESDATAIDYNSTVIISENPNTAPVWLQSSTFGGEVIPPPTPDPITIVWTSTNDNLDLELEDQSAVTITITSALQILVDNDAELQRSYDDTNGFISDQPIQNSTFSPTFALSQGAPDNYFRIYDPTANIYSNVLKFTKLYEADISPGLALSWVANNGPFTSIFFRIYRKRAGIISVVGQVSQNTGNYPDPFSNYNNGAGSTFYSSQNPLAVDSFGNPISQLSVEGYFQYPINTGLQTGDEIMIVLNTTNIASSNYPPDIGDYPVKSTINLQRTLRDGSTSGSYNTVGITPAIPIDAAVTIPEGASTSDTTIGSWYVVDTDIYIYRVEVTTALVD